ncbi:MAG TPA: PPOX class F420-dependent oxidoreductase [Promineifilum sp.]
MSATIPDSHIDLITGPVFAVLSTVSPGGQPENTVVWCSLESDHILVTTIAGRRKYQNVKHNHKVALTAVDPKDAYRWLDVRGFVEEIVPDIDYAVINSHSLLYDGIPEFYSGANASRRGNEERVVLRIRPVRVLTYPH